MASPNYLLRNEAAQYVREKWGVRCAPKTLAKLACIGGGPEFRRAGRSPLYEPEQLDAWVLSRCRDDRRQRDRTFCDPDALCDIPEPSRAPASSFAA